MSQPDRTDHTALYRYLDAQGHPLYIGITSHLPDRQKAHASMPWAREAASFEIEWYASGSEAAAAEEQAIRTERPTYNDAHNFDDVPFTCTSWPQLTAEGRQKATKLASLVKAEIDSGKWAPNHRIPSPRAIAAAVGIGNGAAIHAIGLLKQERYVYRYKSYGHFVCER